MTDQRIEGTATEIGGKVQSGLGNLTGDSKLQADGKFNEIKGKAKDYYGQAVDKLETLVDKAPVQYQDKARAGVDFARNKPLLTTGIVAGLALILSRAGRRR